jgi:hypothetical protein
MVEPSMSYYPPESPLAKFGEGGGGSAKSDGGMAAAVDKMGAGIAWDRRCREVHSAVGMLPTLYRSIVAARFQVGKGEKPRSEVVAAALVEMDRRAYREAFQRAVGRLEGILGITEAPIEKQAA